MQNIGDIARARDIGLAGSDGYRKYIWSQCPKCLEKRWVVLRNGKPVSQVCRNCEGRMGADNPFWKGGIKHDGYGYIQVLLRPDDFFFPMVQSGGYVREHRLVIAKSLGRCLQRWEIVHHLNGIKDDNRLANLALTENVGNHSKQHSQGYNDGFKRGLLDGHTKQIQDMKQRIKILEEEVLYR